MALVSDGIQMTIKTVGYSACKVDLGGSVGVAHFSEAWCKQFAPGFVIVVSNADVKWYEGEIHFHADRLDSKVFMCPSPARGDMTAIEIFSGLGGWTQAAKSMGLEPVLLIDSDERVAHASAKRLGTECVSAKQFVELVLTNQHSPQHVIHDDVRNPDTWVAIGLANAHVLLGSPPCPPWSNAGTAQGLQSEDGKVFQSVLRQAAKLCMSFAVIENVPGLVRHPDFRDLVNDAEQHGMKLKVHGVHACSKVLPVQRDRWLGTFVHESIEVEQSRVVMAGAIAFTDRAFESVATCPSIKDADAIHVNMRDDERLDLMIKRDVLNMLGLLELAPTWLKNRLNGVENPTCDQVLAARVVVDCQQFSGFMAMYGRQHLLSLDLLQTKGLQTVLIHDKGGKRMISPWEMLAAMGYDAKTVLCSDLLEAWRMAGNGLTAAHAWLQIYKTHVLLGKSSPFMPDGMPLQQVAELQSNAIKLSSFESAIEEGFWVLKEKVCESDAKKPRVDLTCPSTVPFSVDDDDDHLATSALQKEPVFEQVQDPRKCAVAGAVYGGGLVAFQHEQKNWMMFVNAPEVDTVESIVRRALPHARERHFRQFMFGGSEVTWSQTIACKPVKGMSFCPVFTSVTCREVSLNLALKMQVDVTWTTKAAVAFSAVKIGCSPDALALTCHDAVLKDDDFLLEYERTEFQIKFKACMPGYVSWAPCVAETADPGMAPAHNNLVRWFARHPVRKSLKTVPANGQHSVAQLVQMLFPDLHATTSWTVFHGDIEVAGKDTANQWSHLKIQWNGYRPLQVTEIRALGFDTAVDSPAAQVRYSVGGIQRYVRSPFKVRSDLLWLSPNMLVGEVAASYLSVAQLQVAIIAMQGTKVVDPCLQIGETTSEDVLTFRLCPLLGGAKGDPKTRITNMLQAKGVPQDKVEQRVKDLLSKVPIDKFKTGLTDDAFWTQVKTFASEAKFRLITLDELKAFQVANRKGKEKASGSAIAETKKAEPFLSDANKIVVDAAHFSTEGKEIALLESTRFGPDQSGVCVTNPADARKWINQGIKSCDPLALFVVGKGCQDFGEVFSIPAHTVNGLPVIVQGALVQFGDLPIEFNLKIPSVVVDQVASTTIEFVIFKEHVANWNDVAVPLHYVGVHIPELRGSNLLATWSIKAWMKQSPVHFSKADHWHGFFRIADTLLEPVLGRSGSAGIFLNPKTSDRRHDPRFVTIALPNGKLTDVIGKAEACPKALGVAKRGDAFCVRCKREDADQLRAILMPESAYVETASFSDEEMLFSLTNVPQVNRDELSSALAKAGWNANAIKPQGWKRWIVAAKTQPPASHFGINGTIVVVEKMKKAGGTMQPVTMFAREFKVDTVRDGHNNLLQVSTTSRIAEIKAQMDDQIAAVVEHKMAQAHARIEELTHALQEVKSTAEQAQNSLAGDMNQMKQEQEFTRQKLHEVETSVTSSGQAIIQQMQTMFTTMQSSLEKSMQQNMANDADKRQRIDDNANKADPFATKS